RPLVSRPDRDPHPRLRGREPRGMVRRQFRRLRTRQDAAAGDRFDDPAPDQVQEVLAVIALFVGRAISAFTRVFDALWARARLCRAAPCPRGPMRPVGTARAKRSPLPTLRLLTQPR